MDEHNQLAKRMLESSESLSVQQDSQSLELSPLEKLVTKAQVRWPFPEMGDLEMADWLETLNFYPLNEIAQALDRLMRQPPKRDLPDGSITEYRGRPTLVDVTRTIDILREERSQEYRKRESAKEAEEMWKLEQRRREHPEEFFGLADVLKAANLTEAKQGAKAMPEAKAQFADINPEANAEKLEQQRRELLK